MDTIIQVEQLGKEYRLGKRAQYQSLRDSISNLWNRSHEKSNSIWALKGISFSVQKGDVLGVIGANGSGKSTLLKLLSRVTNPTEGTGIVSGRIGSLLEVGTGFHPELTGRENIFLNGSILGMRKREIENKFDQIVEFSGVESFLDTSVKHYSSGMYVRLAFSVAAFLDVDILLIDEVLAVGDAAFQLRCLNKMSELTSGNKTILFVSHNLEAVKSLCNRCILLEHGKLLMEGNSQDCIDQYLSNLKISYHHSDKPILLENHSGRTKRYDGPVLLESLEIFDSNQKYSGRIECGKPFSIKINYCSRVKSAKPNMNFIAIISNAQNRRIATLRSFDALNSSIDASSKGEVICKISKLQLAPGIFHISVGCLTEAGYSDIVYDAATVEVFGSQYYPSNELPSASYGEVLFDHEWKVVQ